MQIQFFISIQIGTERTRDETSIQHGELWKTMQNELKSRPPINNTLWDYRR